MNVEVKKQTLTECVSSVKHIIDEALPEMNTESFDYLLSDMKNAIFTVVVVGEFKRGKSTFVNALLGRELLPADVTPTTACIHALTYGEEETGTIFYKDNSRVSLSLDEQVLQKFVADSEEDLASIQYIGLTMKNKLLENRVVLVDTPGIDDINEQRSDVTYQYIPRADAVFFLLDAASPVKGSEQRFLEGTLLEQGKENIIFLANFMDRIEEEEVEESLEVVRRRIAKSANIKNPVVLPLAARDALHSKLTNDPEELEHSGITTVETEMQKMIAEGSTGKASFARYEKRFYQLKQDLFTSLSFQVEVEAMSVKETEKQLEAVKEAMQQMEEIKSDMKDYVHDRKEEILAIVNKSLEHLEEELSEEVSLMMNRYEGLNFEKLIQEEVPFMIKRRLKIWIEQHIRHIHRLYEMLEREIAVGLATEFNAKVEKIYVQRAALSTPGETQFNGVSANDLSNTPALAGLMAGGAGAVALVLGGPLLLPIVAMAGMPVIQKRLAESRSGKVKREVYPIVMEEVNKSLRQFSKEVLSYVKQGVADIYEASGERMTEVTKERSKQLQERLNEGLTTSADTEENIKRIEQVMGQIHQTVAAYEKNDPPAISEEGIS